MTNREGSDGHRCSGEDVDVSVASTRKAAWGSGDMFIQCSPTSFCDSTCGVLVYRELIM